MNDVSSHESSGTKPAFGSKNPAGNAATNGSPGRQQDRRLVAETLRRFEDDGAVAVELRPTLDRWRSDVQRKLQDVVLGYFEYLTGVTADRTPVAMGIVPSLFKQEALNDREPGDPAFWELQAKVWVEEVRALLAVLDEVPALRWFVVGVDAAGKERGCPPRTLRQAFDLVREHNRGRSLVRPGRHMSVSFMKGLVAAANDPAGKAASAWAAWEQLNAKPVHPIRLGITVHAGEDFVDPLTGLRNIWEAAVDLELGEGDRIGHALAAGLDTAMVEALFERRAKAPDREVEALGPKRFALRKPRGTHLLDLAWVRRTGTEADAHLAERWLGAVATRAFGVPTDAAQLAGELGRRDGALVRPVLPGVRYCDPSNLSPQEWETVIIDEGWLDLIERMRQVVIRELVVRTITVESCPTSNIVVKDLDRPPLWTLAKEESLQLALATDDPGLLSCYPCTELMHTKKEKEDLQDGEDPEALRQRVLETAARASFVIPTP